MKRIAVLTVLALLAARAPGMRAMEMVEPSEHPERAHLERAEREMQEQREQQMRHAEELQREAQELMRHADELQGREEQGPGMDELRARARRVLTEAEEIRRKARRRPDMPRVTVRPRLARGAVPQAVVVPLDAMEPERIAQIKEDLSVMARVLEKVVGREFRGGIEGAGAPAFFTPLLGRQDMPSLYLHGYGAVFFLSVDFPLAGPGPAPAEEPRDEPGSLWEETRRELHHPADFPFEPAEGFGDFAPGRDWGPRGGRFDPERVERLKTTILDAMRHAAHIRALGRDESVTILVNGTGAYSVFWNRVPLPEGREPRPDRPEGAPQLLGMRFSEEAAGQTLIIRAAKRDIDALAEGRLKLDQFAERATVIMQ